MPNLFDPTAFTGDAAPMGPTGPTDAPHVDTNIDTSGAVQPAAAWPNVVPATPKPAPFVPGGVFSRDGPPPYPAPPGKKWVEMPPGSGFWRWADDASSTGNTGSTPTPAPSGGTGAPTTTTTGPVTGDSGSGSSGGADPTITTLMGLIASQYASAGVKGGGTGFDGLVSAPLATDVTGVSGAAAPSHTGIIVLGGIVVLIFGIWYYVKHHKKAA